MEGVLIVAVIALTISIALSFLGLLLNYRAQRRANQLVVARRYHQATQVLSAELQVRAQIITLFKRRKSEERQELVGLAKTTIEEQNERIQQIELLQREIEAKFGFLDKEDPADVEKRILQALNSKKNAQMTLKRFKSSHNPS